MSEELIQAVGECGAIVSGHFVLSSGRHSDGIFDAGAVIRRADDRLAGWIAAEMVSGIESQIDTVMGVATKGNDLAEWCSTILSGTNPESHNGLRPVTNLVKTIKLTHNLFEWEEPINGMCSLYGKRVLVVEDVVTSGETVRRAVAMARRKGADVVGVTTLCSHGKATANSLGVPEFHPATVVGFNTHAQILCPMCRDYGYESVRTDFGHGREFLNELRDKGLIPA